MLGFPVAQSLSPKMHNAAYETLGLDWEYEKHEANTTTFNDVITRFIAQGYSGFNITMPCKESAFEFCDETHGAASRLHSVNTIIVEGSKTHGYSTDGQGFINFLEEEYIEIKNKNVVVLGSGGASRAICDALYDNGASVILCARNEAASQEICSTISSVQRSADLSPSITFKKFDNRHQIIRDCDIIINATPIGMQGVSNDVPFEIASLREKHIVIDTIYHPLHTELFNAAKALGCQAYNGISMLLHQGALSFELMTGEKAPLDSMRKALMDEIERRQ